MAYLTELEGKHFQFMRHQSPSSRSAREVLQSRRVNTTTVPESQSRIILSIRHPTLTAPTMSDQQQNKKRKVTSDENLNPSAPPHNLLIKKHSEKGRVPTRGSALAAGYDLYRLDNGVSRHS